MYCSALDGFLLGSCFLSILIKELKSVIQRSSVGHFFGSLLLCSFWIVVFMCGFPQISIDPGVSLPISERVSDPPPPNCKLCGSCLCMVSGRRFQPGGPSDLPHPLCPVSFLPPGLYHPRGSPGLLFPRFALGFPTSLGLERIRPGGSLCSFTSFMSLLK